MPRRRMGILPDDQHPHRVHRGGKRPQHQWPGREVAAAAAISARELAQLSDYLRDRRQRCRPRVDEVGERARRHTFSFSPVNGCPGTYAAGRLSR